jgi:hypothetical protein
MTERQGTFWLVYELHTDGSPDILIPFGSELPALRSAVTGGMRVTKVRFGKDLVDQILEAKRGESDA